MWGTSPSPLLGYWPGNPPAACASAETKRSLAKAGNLIIKPKASTISTAQAWERWWRPIRRFAPALMNLSKRSAEFLILTKPATVFRIFDDEKPPSIASYRIAKCGAPTFSTLSRTRQKTSERLSR